MKTILFIIFPFVFQVFAQTDWVKWQAVEANYELNPPDKKQYIIDDSDFGSLLLSSFQNGYYFLISDLDGNNCPFHPSCSAFFVQSVKGTNIFQGLLMFADRFTRDTNLFRRKTQYSKHISGKYYDPYYNYALDIKKIKIIPFNKYFH